MATATTETTIADLLESLGGIPARRVLLNPRPGTASERDLIRLNERGNRRYELFYGTLVEKAMGFDESIFVLLSWAQTWSITSGSISWGRPSVPMP